MSLAPGVRLGSYEVVAPLGSGGMGEVYRARDSKLKREVAIKVLAPAFAQDPDRIARFEREAIALAALHHPHIASLFGMEVADGQHFLVMELVEGETLADRLARGPVSLDDTLALARQIAEALEAAHEKGVIHRDLKPANIKITPDGQAKVLDFGLAAVVVDPNRPSADVSQSPTLSIHATQAGIILGTAAYMSPEQASGKPVDKRTDIWSFGVVLWEMLAGKRLFEGETLSHTLADVLRAPIDFSTLTRETPPRVRELVRRCLERDVRKRLRDIGEARVALEQNQRDGAEAATSGTQNPIATRAAFTWLAWTLAALFAATTAATAWFALRPVPAASRPLIRLQMDLGPGAAIEVGGPSLTAVLSPDGTRVVFPMSSSGSPDRVVARRALGMKLLNAAKPTLIDGTTEGRDPFFSPDGRWLGFFAGGKLRKVPVAGGPPIDICDAPNGRGAAWAADGNIIGALTPRDGLAIVSAAGGQPRPLTTAAPHDATHRWPQLLPGDRAAIFTAGSANAFDNNDIKMVRLDTGAITTVLRGGYFGRYLPLSQSDGVLLYVRGGVMFGVPFDPQRGQTHGTPVALLDDVAANPNQGRGQFDVSSDGTLVYASGRFSGGWTVGLFESTGAATPLIAKPDEYVALRFSPDGGRLATAILGDMWVYDIKREVASRVTYEEKNARDAVWSPEGEHLAYQARPTSGSEIWWTRADGAGQPQLLFKPEKNELTVPMSFSPDGKRLAFFSGTLSDLLMLPLDLTDPDHPVPGKPEVFLQTPFREQEPMFSPDGRWIGYQSDESGRMEVYVRPYPGPGAKVQISSGGGVSARWSRAARELFFVGADGRLSMVRYSVTGDRFEASKPTVWSSVYVNRSTSGSVGQDIAPDGKHFAVIRGAEDVTGQAPMTVLVNFVDEVRRRMAEAAGK